MTVYEDEYFRYMWKPHGMPTTYGEGPCFLEMIYSPNPSKIEGDLLQSNLPEFGLVNRLDTDTAGLLYFAKTQEIYDQYKKLQREGMVTKIYYATVYGDVQPEFFWIPTPIGHSKDDAARMVAISNGPHPQPLSYEERRVLYRGKLQPAVTYCEKVSYNKEKNQTLLEVRITKGVRHQIRVHLASVGYPIVNDSLYVNKKIRRRLRQDGFFSETGELQLVSVGLVIGA